MQLSVQRRVVANIPWVLVVGVLVTAVVGIYNLASASRPPSSPVWTSQLLYLGVGISLVVGISFVDYRFIQRATVPLYLLNIVALLGLKLFGHTAKGAESWFVIGPFRIQPAEFMKIGMVLMLAKYFHDDDRPNQPSQGFMRLIPAGVIALVPTGIVLVQPDLGTALMMVFTAITIILFSKPTWQVWAALGVVAVLGVGVLWNDYVREQPQEDRFTVIRHKLKKHQDARISGWLDPMSDLRGSNYHSMQSKIAVGSGGWSGKGWMQGTQTGLRYLPEQHTDFIFSVYAEEQGFLRALILLFLYGVVLVGGLTVALSAKDKFGAFVAVGICAMIFWQVFENIGMVTGLLPITGITLPLMSYGGSSMVSVMIGIGLLVNIAMGRKMFRP
ncbi:MAG: rod shape-determining protein RodA [Archangium gephyra]|uniref:Cell wall polymerase n=1 Tax=Archangium gephyra TaxID=48 RepID=A0A2W5T5Z0_9BACT|nr:MAG: rod shape-determining protein RodA [Archangium gephyra]